MDSRLSISTPGLDTDKPYSFRYGNCLLYIILDTQTCPRSEFDALLERWYDPNDTDMLDAFLSRAIKDDDVDLFIRIYSQHTNFVEFIKEPAFFIHCAELLLSKKSNEIIKYMIVHKDAFPHDFLNHPRLLDFACGTGNADLFKFLLDLGLSRRFRNICE